MLEQRRSGSFYEISRYAAYSLARSFITSRIDGDTKAAFNVGQSKVFTQDVTATLVQLEEVICELLG